MYDYYNYYGYSNPSYYTTNASPTDIAGIKGFMLGAGVFVWIILLALVILILIAKWQMFKKANVGGWEALIPIHSDIVELQLGKVTTAWWFLNLTIIIPFIGFIGPLFLLFWKSIAISKAFGKGTGFGVLLAFFPFVCYPILGFGSAQYVGTQNDQSTPTPTPITPAE